MKKKITNNRTYYMKGKKMWQYPSNKTIERLKKLGYTNIIWKNGDFLYI